MFSQARFLVDPEENHFAYKGDYDSVMQFVRLNKTIPGKLTEIDASPDELAKVEALLAAVMAGNLTHQVFSDHDCQLYVIHLFKHKRISLIDFLSLNFYLNVLSQHTDKQPLREEDHDLRILTEVAAIPMNDVLDVMTQHMTKDIFKRKYKDKLNADSIKQAIANLNPLNRLIIRIRDYDHPKYHHRDVKNELSNKSMFVFKHEGFIYFQLAGVCHAVLSMLNPEAPMKMAPVFGKTGIATTFKMHQKGFHPVILYSPFVASNTTEIHGARAGLPESTMHDITPHVDWGNIMPLNICRFIYECLLPVAEIALNVSYDEIKQDYKTNNLIGYRFSNVLDLNFIEDIDHTEEPHITILHEAIKCIATQKINGVFMLYQALHARLDEIKRKYQLDIHAVFHHQRLFERHYMLGTLADFQEKTRQLDSIISNSC